MGLVESTDYVAAFTQRLSCAGGGEKGPAPTDA
jgi:hypothetical protein